MRLEDYGEIPGFDPDEWETAMTMGIEKYKQIRSQMALRKAQRDEGLRLIREDLRRCADSLSNEGFTRWWAILLNIEQSVSDPTSYRRIP